jgi:hypothetical protein
MPGDTLDYMGNFMDHHMTEHGRGVFHRFNPIEEYDDVPAIRHGVSKYTGCESFFLPGY